MTSLSKKSVSGRIPLYSLYGRTDAEAELSFVHLETLESGNEGHDWNILAHRHHDLHQIIWVSKGYGTVELDTHTLFLRSPVLIYVPPLVVHGFRWKPGSDGFILTMAGTPLAGIISRSQAPEIISVQDQPLVITGDSTKKEDVLKIRNLFAAISGEYIQDLPCRDVAISSNILILLVEIVRLRRLYSSVALTQEVRSTEVKHQATFRRFKGLIERHMRQHYRVADYACSLATSTRNLNRLCFRLAGKTPSQVIQQRMMLEARRYLLYTDKTIAEIGYELGFEDPSYFTRFFVREEGIAPAAFRQIKR
ncbi:helix-turn-helix domain-containing protein [Eoetvoesiella caeni]